MLSFERYKLLLTLIVLLCCQVFFSLVQPIYINNVSAISTEDVTEISKQKNIKFGRPVRLKIPKIGVDANFEYVGLTSDGAMDVPKNFAKVAWYNLGPRPGEKGSAVIAGHYGRKTGKGSVFDNLNKLRKGDKLSIKEKKGKIITFVVRKVQTFDPEEDALEVFSSNDGKAHLNLITCEGVWNKVSRTYSKRLVVFTDRVKD